MYNDWLSALRALSPSSASLAAQGLPQVATTEAWGRRILNTQLASWAELRHDTILYNKQSYTSGASCEFPDAAVDPYPELYAAIARLAAHGEGLSQRFTGVADGPWLDSVNQYFTRLGDIAAMLESIADTQATHGALSAEQLKFVNDAVVVQKVPAGCTSVDEGSGWFTQLYFSQGDVLAYAPTIADVHTQPTDEVGAPVGRVLHVGTGMPRLMVVTLDGCDGARAYAGLSSSYYEQITQNFERLTDAQWKQTLMRAPPPAPAWLHDLVAAP
jgi:hypothetical protein